MEVCLKEFKVPVDILARLLFILPERIIYRVMLNDLYPDFICSHNQIYTIESRGYSSSSLFSTSDDTSTEEVEESESDVLSENPFDNHSNPEEMIKSRDVDGNIVVDAATLPQVIRFLFDIGTGCSSKFRHSVIMCFLYFTNLPELLNDLTKYLKKNACTDQSKPENQVVLRVTNLLKQIVDHHKQLFAVSKNAECLMEFITDTLTPISSPCGKLLSQLLVKRMSHVAKDVEVQFGTKPPKPKVTKSDLEKLELHLRLATIAPLELARQLAIRDLRLFQQINLEECIHMRWTKSNKNDLAPNIILSIRQFCR